MVKKSYSEKLKSPLWQRRRLEILQRDNFTCVLCGDTETELQINHLKYTGEPHEAPNEDLETLCKHCHLLKHTVNEKINSAFKFKYESYVVLIYVNDLGTCSATICDNSIKLHSGFYFNSPTLAKLYELNTTK